MSEEEGDDVAVRFSAEPEPEPEPEPGEGEADPPVSVMQRLIEQQQLQRRAESLSAAPLRKKKRRKDPDRQEGMEGGSHPSPEDIERKERAEAKEREREKAREERRKQKRTRLLELTATQYMRQMTGRKDVAPSAAMLASALGRSSSEDVKAASSAAAASAPSSSSSGAPADRKEGTDILLEQKAMLEQIHREAQLALRPVSFGGSSSVNLLENMKHNREKCFFCWFTSLPDAESDHHNYVTCVNLWDENFTKIDDENLCALILKYYEKHLKPWAPRETEMNIPMIYQHFMIGAPSEKTKRLFDNCTMQKMKVFMVHRGIWVEDTVTGLVQMDHRTAHLYLKTVQMSR